MILYITQIINKNTIFRCKKNRFIKIRYNIKNNKYKTKIKKFDIN